MRVQWLGMHKKAVLLLALLAASGFLGPVVTSPVVHAQSTIVLNADSCVAAPLNGNWNDSTNDCEVGYPGSTIPSGTTIQIDSGTSLGTDHMITIQGIVDNSGLFSVYESNVSAGVVSVDSGGVIDSSGQLNVGPGSTLLNSGTIDTSNNSGTVDTSNFTSVDGTIINSGTISNSGGFSINTDGTVDNSGTFVTSAPEPFGLHIGGVFSNTGLLDDQSGISMGNGNGGTLDNQVGGTVEVESGTLLFDVGAAPGVVINNYGTLDSYGVVSATINNYGTFDNYGANGIWTTETFDNYGVFNNFNTMGILGTLNNNAGATIDNTGYLFNNGGGVINNMGTMTGNPTIVETCQSTQQASATVTSGSTSTAIFMNIGMNVSISDTTGSTAEISASQLTSQPTNTGGLSVNGSNSTSFGFYDLAITGISGGTAHLCMSNVNADANTVIDYYSNGSWIQAANITFTPGTMVCGDILVAALSGSPFALGGPLTTPTTTTTLILGGVAVAVVVVAAGFFLLRRRRQPRPRSIEERIP